MIIGIQSEIYISLRSSATQPIKKTAEKKQFLRENIVCFVSGETTRLTFVKDVF